MSDDPLIRLQALNALFINNFVTKDVEAYDAIIHEEFICLMPDGARVGRATYLKRWATAFDPDILVYWDYRDELISIFGNIALVRSANKYLRRTNDSEQMGMTVYTDTYLREQDEWKCIQAQLTPMSPEHYPSDDTIIRAWINGRPQAV